MTDHKQALQELLEKVESGEWDCLSEMEWDRMPPRERPPFPTPTRPAILADGDRMEKALRRTPVPIPTRIDKSDLVDLIPRSETGFR